MNPKKDKKSSTLIFKESETDYRKQDTEPFSYDRAMAAIQQLVEDMQQPSITMDELLQKQERANVLINLCQEKLRAIKPKFDIPF
jgi:exodeoxyribonuclease VII small subunit